MSSTPQELMDLDNLDFHIQTRKLENSLLEYTKWYFPTIKKEPFIASWHHNAICKVLEQVYNGDLTHVIINLPPRYTKTELVVKAFISWCILKNRKSKFLHLSYSDDLALDNSSQVKELILEDAFQAKWDIELKKDSQSKKKWYTLEGGGVYATSTGGQITGFGAGSLNEDVFEGAIIIDDPIKPEDASSDVIRSRMNERFNNTIKSRTNSKKTPIIIIMQRLHEDDMTGFLLDGGSEFDFFHLNLPAINEDGPNEYDPRFKGEALWPRKHDALQLKAMEAKSIMTYAGQYQQRPAPAEGNIIKKEQIKFYMELPKTINYKAHSWDFTFKKSNNSDYVVGQVWGRTKDRQDFYLIDLIRDKMSFNESLEAIKHLAKKHPDYNAVLVEEKANGAAIIDSITRDVNRVIPINPDESKEARFEAMAPLFFGGNVYLPHPSICPWVNMLIDELITFPNSKHDDQCDSMSQALNFLDMKGSGDFPEYDRDNQQDPYRESFLKRPHKKRESRIKVRTF